MHFLTIDFHAVESKFPTRGCQQPRDTITGEWYYSRTASHCNNENRVPPITDDHCATNGDDNQSISLLIVRQTTIHFINQLITGGEWGGGCVVITTNTIITVFHLELLYIDLEDH